MQYLKQLTAIITVILITILLQACGGSSSTKKVEPTTDPTAVHLIKPADIPAYVAKFKLQQAQLDLQIEGKQYKINLIDMDFDEKVIVAKYELGFIFIGFDFSKEQPIASLRLVEGDIINGGQPDRILDGSNIKIEEQDNNYIYSGSVINAANQNMFSVRLVFNESLLEGGSSTVKVVDNKALINGTLGTNTYIQITDLTQNHPEVKTLVLQQIDGSINDAINMHTGRLVRNAQLTTLIPADGDVYSGGVDLFAAGFERKYEPSERLVYIHGVVLTGKLQIS